MTTTRATALQVVRALYDAFGRRVIPTAIALWHPQITWTEPEGATGVTGGRITAFEQVADTVQVAAALAPAP